MTKAQRLAARIEKDAKELKQVLKKDSRIADHGATELLQVVTSTSAALSRRITLNLNPENKA